MKIVLPINDEHFGQSIVEHVVKHKWPDSTASFKLLHILEWAPSANEMSASPALSDYALEQRQRAEKLLAVFAEKIKQALPDASIEMEVREGRPAEQIIAAAKAWAADQIVMGSHSRHGIGLFLIGSVSAAVATHTDCSVTIVRSKAS